MGRKTDACKRKRGDVLLAKSGGISFLGEERIGETVGGSNRVSAKMKKQLF